MTELSGTLEGVGLPAIVRFLSALNKTGCLRIAQDEWQGELFFDAGQVTGARLGSRTGLAALEGLVHVLPNGRFSFDVTGHTEDEPNLSLSAEALHAYLEDLGPRLPALDAVPMPVSHEDQSTGSEPLPLDRSTVQTLLAIDGRRTVREIIAQRGSLDALWQLSSLAAIGLVRLESPGAGPQPPVARQAASSPPETTAGPTAASPQTHDDPASANLAGAAPGMDAARGDDAQGGSFAEDGSGGRQAEETPRPLRPTYPAPAARFAQTANGPRRAEMPGGPRPGQDAAAARGVQSQIRPGYPAMAARSAHSVNAPRPADPPDTERAADVARPQRPADPPGPQRPNPWARVPRVSETPVAPPTNPEGAVGATLPVACPRLGFEDDPSNSFGRPTRLHRCFAAGAPLPLSLDQQRELCLSDQYGTCPRLTAGDGAAAGAAPPSEPTTAIDAHSPEPEADEPRILRPPFIQRAAAANRGAVADRQAVGGTDPTRLRGPAVSARVGADVRPTPPTPLRARMERTASDLPEGAVVDPPAPAAHELARSEANAVRPAPTGEPIERRLTSFPRPLIFGVGAVVILALAAIGYLLLPRLSGVFTDDGVNPSALPNSSAIAAGTPISAINLPRPTPGAVANRASTSASGASGATAPAQPTLLPEPDKVAAPQTRAQPATQVGAQGATQPGNSAAQPDASAAAAIQPNTSAGQPGTAGSQTGAPAPQMDAAAGSILDERFTSNARNWPSNTQGTATLTNGSYRLAPRLAGQFVAIGAPTVDVPQDVVVTADFRKLSGPAGGGYGIIVRDQGSGALDGNNQNGRFYVLEAGDKGEVGIWRRDGDHWVDLLPWQHADAVKTGNAVNELTVRVVGNRLSLSVNGTEVATRTDGTFAGGNVGLFVGGDGNQVAVDHFSIQQP